MAIEIVEFPTNSMVIFQFAMLVYQRVTTKEFWKTKKQHVKKKNWQDDNKPQAEPHETGHNMLKHPKSNKIKTYLKILQI